MNHAWKPDELSREAAALRRARRRAPACRDNELEAALSSAARTINASLGGERGSLGSALEQIVIDEETI